MFFISRNQRFSIFGNSLRTILALSFYTHYVLLLTPSYEGLIRDADLLCILMYANHRKHHLRFTYLRIFNYKLFQQITQVQML